jgi:formate hydrogenlyase subunit 3/multisubunit Na+/H+ antiporter MnhD subunit
VGSLTLAGLPPTAGFVSEWFLLESLMQQFRVLVETYSYRPALGVLTSVVTAAKRLQSGRLDAYLLYMLIALIAVIAVATALA